MSKYHERWHSHFGRIRYAYTYEEWRQMFGIKPGENQSKENHDPGDEDPHRLE